MKKRSLLILVLVLCLLFSGFTRTEAKTPSRSYGTAPAQCGSFTVPVPDYYKKETDGSYSYGESYSKTSAILKFGAGDAGDIDFEKNSGDLLDACAAKIYSGSGTPKRTGLRKLSVAGCPAAIGTYTIGKKLKLSTAIVYNAAGNEALVLFCAVDSSAKYGSYQDDFARMVSGITLTGGSPAPAASAANGGVTPEVKEFWDSFEAFVDEYVQFMTDYMKNPTSFSLLSRFGEFVQKLADFEKKADAYSDSSRYSSADVAYSLEVYGRILQKLASVL